MKKILLATSALVASTGFAAAEVTVGGDGYMGILYSSEDLYTNSRNDSAKSYQFVRDLDIDFTASGESDGGLVFGASIDADDTPKAQGINGWDGTTFVSGDWGKLSMGDTDGGAEAVIGDLGMISLTGLGDFSDTLFLLGATEDVGPLALYEYSAGGLSLALGIDDDEGYSVGAGYAGDFWSVGLGYESIPEGATINILDNDLINNSGGFDIPVNADVTHLIGAGAVTFSGFTVTGIYGQLDAGSFEVDQYGLSGEYAFDAWSVAAYWKKLDSDDVDFEAYGLGVGYDLGGGLGIEAGVVQADLDGAGDGVLADFGLTFSF